MAWLEDRDRYTAEIHRLWEKVRSTM